ncbi:hypothetical protein BOX15_Mlig016504g5, partial [Macrostomum lignano]
MGLHDSPGSFQRCINKLLDGLTPKTALGYMDDIVVHSVTFEEQLDNLRTVLQRIIAANLKVKPKKCHLFLKELHYLGHVVTPDGLKTCEDKIAQIRDWPVPQSVTQLRQFLGLANYYHKFVDGYAGVAAPLHALTRKDIGSLRQHWTPEHQHAFDTLKKKLCSTEVLALPEFNSDPAVKFVLDTDASDIRIGACLGQLQSDGVERPIAFFSRKLRDPEKRYTVTKKELLAILDAMRHFRHYLIGKKFEVRSDHRALLWLLNQTQATGILGRWIERLSEFRFQLNHRKGKDHANADALSRRPETPPINFEHGRLLKQPGSTAQPGAGGSPKTERRRFLETDLDATPEATARAALQKTVHPRYLEAETDLDEDLEATAPAAFQHDAHRCSQRLEIGLDDNPEATVTTALCSDAHADCRYLETNLDEVLEATAEADLLDDAQDFRSRNL